MRNTRNTCSLCSDTGYISEADVNTGQIYDNFCSCAAGEREWQKTEISWARNDARSDAEWLDMVAPYCVEPEEYEPSPYDGTYSEM
jgi:hypothetical protein